MCQLYKHMHQLVMQHKQIEQIDLAVTMNKKYRDSIIMGD